MTQCLSVIIPTLNEAGQIEHTIASIMQHHDPTIPLEIIVADGGSGDQTVELAVRRGARVVHSAPGRANQMNAGARVAKGNVLIFLHADTQLPPNFTSHIAHALSQPEAIAGAFELEIDSSEPLLRWVERGVKWRSRYLQMPYGDQALFMTAVAFQQVGGFPTLPILEDVEMVKQLRRLGQIVIVRKSVRTSARRWQRLGIIETTMFNQFVLLAFRLGVSPNRIANWYRTAPHWRKR